MGSWLEPLERLVAHDNGRPALLFGKGCNEFDGATGELGGQRSDGFVEQKQPLAGHESAQERDALGLARRELPGAAGHERAESEALDDACLSFGALLAEAVGGLEVVADSPTRMKR